MFTCSHTEPTCRDAQDHIDRVEREVAAPVDPISAEIDAAIAEGRPVRIVARLRDDFSRAVAAAVAFTGPSEVWCSKCERTALAEITLTTGETVARCGKHLPSTRR